MDPVIWSAVLTVMGITGLWLAGSGKKAGWMVGVIAQILWIGYALVTRQYPFIVSALIYGFVYMRNYKKSFTVRQVQIGGDIQVGGDIYTPNELRKKQGLG